MAASIRRHLGGLIGLCLILPLSACSSDDPLPAAQAIEHYDEVGHDIAQALSGEDGTWLHENRGRSVSETEGTCRYSPGSWNPAEDLEAPTDDGAWQARMDVVNPVLEEHGFSEITKTTEQGSRRLLESEDEHGASIRITPEGQIRITSAAVDAEPCTMETLGAS